jgi:hypothetical protein
MPTTFGTSSTFRVLLNHLSTFQVVRVTPSNTVDTAVLFPNPYMPSRGNGYITITQMPPGARVRVFTMRGERIFDADAGGSGVLAWNGTNRSGRAIASGIYLITIEAGSQKKILKLVVIR